MLATISSYQIHLSGNPECHARDPEDVKPGRTKRPNVRDTARVSVTNSTACQHLAIPRSGIVSPCVIGLLKPVADYLPRFRTRSRSASDVRQEVSKREIIDTTYSLLLVPEFSDLVNTVVTLNYRWDEVQFKEEAQKHIQKHASKTRAEWQEEIVG